MPDKNAGVTSAMNTGSIAEYHAHVYCDPATSRARALP